MKMSLHVRETFLLLVLAITPCFAQAGFLLDAKTAKLVDCGDILAYASRYYLMMNNEGLARSLIQEYSMAQTALLAKYYVNGVVADDRIAAFKSHERANYLYLDTNQNKIPSLVNNCRPIINQAANQPSVRDITMWGKNFYEMVELMSAKIRAQYGLR